MKHEWRKKEKEIYLPKNKPETVEIPEYKFLTIEGEGNPNSDFFPEYISVLYSLSYGIKMSPKKGIEPEGYFDYTVYPLEGIWDINEEAKKTYDGTIDKNDLVFKLMIRQPDFVDAKFVKQIMDQTKKKKPHVLLEKVKFEKITDGKCVQMMHVGSYDNEPESFKLMEIFADKENLLRTSKTHREIYLSDFRKVAPEKLKTVLRFKVESK
ncbi:GyrI-like domain-containing protein [Fulvivirgaceae bacterium BMA10]|uniref:GyrI-like domain-containing protein n=1 Tax=Splendidivirga corallicola TaxID=3051826 RepID=A0ABT8KTH8_9BACT|nr:GyrI-like domain-containing protein [Fulvivirgaceae bacterium BMA10]